MNLGAFMLLYKHVLFSIMLFIVSVLVVRNQKDVKKIINLIVFSIILTTLFQVVIYFQLVPESLLQLLIYDKEWDVIYVNLIRGRYFITIYSSALVPILIYYSASATKIFYKIIGLFLLLSVLVFSILSNFRTHLVLALLGLFTASAIYIRKKTVVLIPLGFILLLYLSFQLNAFLTTSSITRIVDPDTKDITSITTRWQWWQQATEMGLSSPIYGVGLRNYFDNSSNIHISGLNNKFQLITLAHPHNIFFGTFAETGFGGLLALFSLLFYLFVSDVRLFKDTDRLQQALILSFWILFLFSTMNPPDTLPYLSLFWLLRALIYRS